MDRAALTRRVIAWYALHARDLPWRQAGVSPWGVLVSEFMLQQTPVARVLEPWRSWLQRWPAPAGLAAEGAGEAVRMWGRLGYPRRALRLHQAATQLVRIHHGEVPADVTALRALPGVGDYTAAAVASFAFGQRHVVLDTNVRRVLTRLDGGQDLPGPSVTTAEKARAQAWLPEEGADAPRWAVGAMELGAQICLAGTPRCHACPVADACRWLALGRPAHDGPPRRAQPYAGTDRQCRGALLAVLRSQDAVSAERLRQAWPSDPGQADRALASLVGDGLVLRRRDGRYRL